MNSDKSTETKSWTYAPSLSDAPKHTVYGPRGEVVATVYHSKDRARLIAAAPDLLALAKQYVSECLDCHYGDGPTGKTLEGKPCKWCGSTRAVIAKATGEHS